MARTDGDCVMGVIEYLEEKAQMVLESSSFDSAVKDFNKFHGAFDALTRCIVFTSDDEYNKGVELYLQLVEYLNATYNMNIEYDATELFV